MDLSLPNVCLQQVMGELMAMEELKVLYWERKGTVGVADVPKSDVLDLEASAVKRLVGQYETLLTVLLRNYRMQLEWWRQL